MPPPERSGGKQVDPPKRGKAGTFAPGVSGNPKGRPPGSRDPKTVLLSELLDGDAPSILAKLTEAAKAGEPWAVRLCVERFLPAMQRRLVLDLPRIETASQVGQAVATVIELAAGGALTIEEARGFLALLEHQRKFIETADLALRVELLEQVGNTRMADEPYGFDGRGKGRR